MTGHNDVFDAQKIIPTMDSEEQALRELNELGDMADLELIQNRVRSFSMYEVLERPLLDFLKEGDGFNATPVYDEDSYPDAEMVDASLINFVKFIATAFGRSRLPDAFKIVERIHRDNNKKKTFRFRSRHPLFIDGAPRYQNICLVSGMVHLGIPILPYFDGEKLIEVKGDDPEAYLALLRVENGTLL